MNRSKPILLSLLAVSSWSSFADECVRLRIALDIGSGSSKMRSGIVNVCTQTVIFQVAKKSAPIAFKAHLSRPDANKLPDGSLSPDGKPLFDREFLKEGADKIEDMHRELVKDTLEKVKTDPKYAAYKDLANYDIVSFGVATEAFRQASNSAEFFTMMRNRGISVRVLSQKEEGRLGFLGVMASTSAPAESYLSWDIGGASLQIVGYAKNEKGGVPWQEYGNRLASEPMRVFVTQNILKKEAFVKVPSQKDPSQMENKATSPNPILTKAVDTSPAEAQQKEDEILASSQVFVEQQIYDLLNNDWIKPRLQSNETLVYGIGGVHGGILSLVKVGNPTANGYSQADLRTLLSSLLYLSDEEITAQYKVPPAFVNGTVTNVMIVYDVMKALTIQKIRVADVDNTLGTFVSPKFWGPLSFLKDKALVNP